MRGRVALHVVAALVVCVAACVAARGGEGEPCKCEGCTIFSGRFYCDDGLICNTGTGGEYRCQRPGSAGAGGACNAWEQLDPSAPVLCAEGLTCTYSGSFDAASGAGVVPCPNLVAWCCEPLPPPCRDCKPDASVSDGS
jgi:hypothetical protein